MLHEWFAIAHEEYEALPIKFCDCLKLIGIAVDIDVGADVRTDIVARIGIVVDVGADAVSADASIDVGNDFVACADNRIVADGVIVGNGIGVVGANVGADRVGDIHLLISIANWFCACGGVSVGVVMRIVS